MVADHRFDTIYLHLVCCICRIPLLADSIAAAHMAHHFGGDMDIYTNRSPTDTLVDSAAAVGIVCGKPHLLQCLLDIPAAMVISHVGIDRGNPWNGTNMSASASNTANPANNASTPDRSGRFKTDRRNWASDGENPQSPWYLYL